MRFALVFFLSLWTSLTIAADGQTVYATCAACHGPKGEGNAALKAPNIAGMDSTYVERQLKLFRRGGRGANDPIAAPMTAAAKAVGSEAELTAVAQYVATLSRQRSTASLQGDLGNGRNYYNGLCSACHDSSGKGNASLQAPRLAGVDVLYLQRQYAAFKAGTRGAAVDDKLGKQMLKMAKALPDEKTEHDVFAYIGTLKP